MLLFKSATKDSSYSVAGNALNALSKLIKMLQCNMQKNWINNLQRELKKSLQGAKAASGDESLEEEIIGDFNKMPVSQANSMHWAHSAFTWVH